MSFCYTLKVHTSLHNESLSYRCVACAQYQQHLQRYCELYF